MYFVKTPAIVKPFARDLVWNIATKEKVVYLTFDDGPTPGVTEQVLGLLKQYKAKATFFCLGEQVAQNPDLFNLLKEELHAIGNHSWSHPNGWKTSDATYFEDVEKAAQLISSSLFRPPYGKASKAQVKELKKHYKIIMWDVLSGDFDASNTPQQCFVNVRDNTAPGSIVVFHDSIKAKENMLYALEETLKYFGEREFRFDVLPFS